MLEGTPPALTRYIMDHTQPEDAFLAELNRQTHLKVLLPRMLSGPYQGQVLSLFSHMIRPRRVLEIGTFTGYSAICWAKGLAQDGLLHTIDINDELARFTQGWLDRSPLAERIRFHVGDALDIIPRLDETFDLVFIDADKDNYLKYYELVMPMLRQGGFIFADNVLWSGKVLDDDSGSDVMTLGIKAFNEKVHHDPRVENVLLPIRDGIMALRKL